MHREKKHLKFKWKDEYEECTHSFTLMRQEKQQRSKNSSFVLSLSDAFFIACLDSRDQNIHFVFKHIIYLIFNCVIFLFALPYACCFASLRIHLVLRACFGCVFNFPVSSVKNGSVWTIFGRGKHSSIEALEVFELSRAFMLCKASHLNNFFIFFFE